MSLRGRQAHLCQVSGPLLQAGYAAENQTGNAILRSPDAFKASPDGFASPAGRQAKKARRVMALDRSQCAGKNLPGKGGFSHQAKQYINLFPKKIIPPGTYFIVLQYHIDSEAGKEDEQGG